MTNLTEKWEKGELPDGHYYVRDGENLIAELLDGYFYNNGEPMTSFSGGVDTILAEVPSYDEWQAIEKYNKHIEEVIKIYERKDKQATETSIAYNELAKENTILKQLLKDCRLAIYDYPPYDSASDKIRLINKIDEVLE